MSQICKTVEVANKTIKVKELTVRQVKVLWNELMEVPKTSADGIPSSMFTNQEFMNRNWALCVEGLTLDEAEDLTPSELKKIYDAFMEVNAVFFALALSVEGEDPMLKGLRQAIKMDLMSRFASFSNEVIPESGIMDTVSS